MLPEVLIAYATWSGSTGEVAEEMAEAMRPRGVMAEVQPMNNVVSIPESKSVLLGAPLHIGRLPKEFHKFVVRFERELSKVHPWIFVLGPTEKKREHFRSAEEQAHKELAKYTWLHPADVRILGGKFDPHHLKLPFPLSLVMKVPGNPMSKLPVSDIRDWEWIRTWAAAVADHLKTPA